MLNLVLFGKPGSGKGTQANFLKDKYDLIHISTGDVFRKNIKNQTELGVKAQAYTQTVSYTHLTLPTICSV